MTTLKDGCVTLFVVTQTDQALSFVWPVDLVLTSFEYYNRTTKKDHNETITRVVLHAWDRVVEGGSLVLVLQPGKILLTRRALELPLRHIFWVFDEAQGRDQMSRVVLWYAKGLPRVESIFGGREYAGGETRVRNVSICRTVVGRLLPVGGVVLDPLLSEEPTMEAAKHYGREAYGIGTVAQCRLALSTLSQGVIPL